MWSVGFGIPLSIITLTWYGTSYSLISTRKSLASVMEVLSRFSSIRVSSSNRSKFPLFVLL